MGDSFPAKGLDCANRGQRCLVNWHPELLMQTNVVPIDPLEPDLQILRQAARLITHGEVVAFPTETVYGLAADALNAIAVRRIFEVKGRPPTNPVIVHVSDLEQARGLVRAWPEAADRLAARFWPGSLTLVLPSQKIVPAEVTAGGPTVGIRMPAHPVAQGLIRQAARPLAAPSANLSARISPTTAAHVLKDLAGRIPLILDGGPTPGGLESTVLDLASEQPRILRPGLVSAEEIEQVLKRPLLRPNGVRPDEEIARSPGLQQRHYAPRVPIECGVDSPRERVLQLLRQGVRVGWIAFEHEPALSHPNLVMERMPPDPNGYSARLYAALHLVEDAQVDRIVVSSPPNDPPWLAVWDRLRRAAAP
jgi:L-threonylcarbamoyladenylate synthase